MKLVRNLLIAGQNRGADATGLSFLADNELRILKAAKPAKKFRFFIPNKVKIVIAHTRAATQGSPAFNFNNQPLYCNLNNDRVSVSHNGIISNDKLLRELYSLPKTQIECDSYIICQLIEHYGKLDFKCLKWVAETISGSFAISILDSGNNLYLVKGSNPIELIFLEEIGVFVYASTLAILNYGLSKSKLSGISYKKIPLKSGDILKISACGEIERSTFNLPTFDPWDFFTRWPISFDTDPSLHELLELGKIAGASKEDIQVLLDMDYDTDEILELLECPKLLHQQLEFFEIGCDDFDL
jgi:glucosamine 6-phosphate synthetase-like amidotransferase/phosphosugar isomerase protein